MSSATGSESPATGRSPSRRPLRPTASYPWTPMSTTRQPSRRAPRARIVHFGQSAGPEASFESAAVRGKELELLGQSNFARTKEELHESHAELLRRVAAGEIRVEFETFGLGDVQQAWTHQASGG